MTNSTAESPLDFGLAPCHARREFDEREGRFFCAHPKVGVADALVLPEFCRVCSLGEQPPPPQFRPRPEPQLRKRKTIPCQHLGDQIGLRECSSCRGQIQVKVFACQHPAHEETTRNACLRCPDYISIGDDASAPSTAT
jgi:hypothetical protein